jgi:hypothetical protein
LVERKENNEEEEIEKKENTGEKEKKSEKKEKNTVGPHTMKNKISSYYFSSTSGFMEVL